MSTGGASLTNSDKGGKENKRLHNCHQNLYHCQQNQYWMPIKANSRDQIQWQFLSLRNDKEWGAIGKGEGISQGVCVTGSLLLHKKLFVQQIKDCF